MDQYEESESWSAPAEQAPPPPPPPPIDNSSLDGTKSHAGFRIDLWNGLPNYHCPVCDVGYLEEDAVIDHILQVHPDYA